MAGPPAVYPPFSLPLSPSPPSPLLYRSLCSTLPPPPSVPSWPAETLTSPSTSEQAESPAAVAAVEGCVFAAACLPMCMHVDRQQCRQAAVVAYLSVLRVPSPHCLPCCLPVICLPAGAPPCASWAPWGSPSTRRPGAGTTRCALCCTALWVFVIPHFIAMRVAALSCPPA